MKNVRSKFLIKIVASLCIVISLLGIVLNNRVVAAGDDEVFGSVLLTPITKLLTGLGDGIMDILHSTVLEQDETIIRLDGEAANWWSSHGMSVLGWIIGIAVAIVLVAITWGAAAPVFTGVGIAAKLGGAAFVVKTIVTSAAIGAATGTGVFIVARVVDSVYLSNDIYLPVFNLTPEEIFSDKIWLFDVDFFEKEEDKNYTLQRDSEEIQVSSIDTASGGSVKYEKLHEAAQKVENEKGGIISISEAKNMDGFKNLIENVNAKLVESGFENNELIQNDRHKFKINYTKTHNTSSAGAQYNGAATFQLSKSETEIFIIYKADQTGMSEYLSIKCSLITYTRGNVNPGGVSTYPGAPTTNDTNYTETVTVQRKEKIVEEKTSIATELRGVVSEWYFTLRNLALIILVLLLIYSGIRIVIGSTAGEKAKYKERIIDWIVSICLIFAMHYLMVFAVQLNGMFIDLVDSTNGINGVTKLIRLNTTNHIDVATKEAKLNDFVKDGYEDYGEPELAGVKFLEWPTNIMGGVRIEQQLVNEGTANWIGYALCYLVLVAYTVFFAWTYLRRVLYMAFLTMIAPLVAMTYSLDKITDGKAQAFNSWLREYIFNLLIQPFHLILYTVLVTSAYQLAAENALYALVAVGFMMPAEKLLRKFFGFEKAQTPGALGGAAGAALAMSGLQKLISFGNKDANPPQEESEQNNDIKFSSADGISAKSIVEELYEGSARKRSSSILDLENGGDDNQGEHTSDIRINGGNTRLAGDELDDSSQKNGGINVNLGENEVRQDRINVLDSEKSGRRDVEIPGGRTEEDPILNKKTDNKLAAGGNVTVSGGGTRRTGVTQEINKEDLKLPKERNGNRFTRGFKAVGTGIKTYSRLQGQKYYKRVKKSRPIRSLARGVAGVATGTFLGMAGLALGIASGDVSKALQYTSAGAVGGWGIGKGVAGRVANAVTVDKGKMKDEMELSYYGADYKKHKLKEQKKEFARDEDNISYIRKTLGVSRGEAIDILETTGAECLDSGIDKVEDVATVHIFTQEQAILNRIEKENAELEKLVQNYEDANWDSEEFELTPEEIKQTDDELNQQFKAELDKLDKEDKAANKKYEEEQKEEDNRQKREKEALERQLKSEARDKIRQEEDEIRKLVAFTDAEINAFNQSVTEGTYNNAKETLNRIQELTTQIAGITGESEEKTAAQQELAQRNAELVSIGINTREELEKKQQGELERRIKEEKDKRIKEYIDGTNGNNGRRAELEKKLNAAAAERQKQLNDRIAKSEKERAEKGAKLDEQIAESAAKKYEQKRRENARKSFMEEENGRYQRAREAGIAAAKESIRRKDEDYQDSYENAMKLGMAMKKYSGRTPDFTKLGAKKIESYRQQFSNEFYEDFIKEENKKIKAETERIMREKRISREKAEKQAKENASTIARNRADAAARSTVKGIRLFDDKKGSLTEARSDKK